MVVFAFLCMSQEQLVAELNVTFHQVHKYDSGTNRISASRLWDISQILDVLISYSFEDMTEGQCAVHQAGSFVAIVRAH